MMVVKKPERYAMTDAIINQLLGSESQRNLIDERNARRGFMRVVDIIGWILLSPLFLLTLLGKLLRMIAPRVHVVGAITGLLYGVLDVPRAAAGVVWNWLVLFFSFAWVRSWGKFLSLFLEPIFGLVFAALSPIAFLFKGIDDAVHPPRELHDNERQLLLRLFPEKFVKRLRIHPEASWMRKISAHGGFTLNEDIYLVDARNQWQGHEALHTLQYRSTPGGAAPFLGRYFGQYLGSRITGKNHNEAYSALDAEDEAHALFSPPG